MVVEGNNLYCLWQIWNRPLDLITLGDQYFAHPHLIFKFQKASNLSVPPTMASAAYKRSYAERAKSLTNPAAKLLLETMERKKTNLCVSVDTVKSADFLAIVDAVGPYTCLVKANITYMSPVS
jgi:hypothetical protein